jgi:hypothetical protein
MKLQTSGRHLYEPLLGIVLFEMRDKDQVVHCMVSECALRNRALVDGEPEDAVEDLFSEYSGEVEAIAAQQYDTGIKNPIVRAFDLARPPSLAIR